MNFFDGPIVGRLKREKYPSIEAALARARELPWWRTGLVLDKRAIRYWVWREKGLWD